LVWVWVWVWVFEQVSDVGETVDRVGGEAGREVGGVGIMGEEVERKEVAVEEYLVSRRQIHGDGRRRGRGGFGFIISGSGGGGGRGLVVLVVEGDGE